MGRNLDFEGKMKKLLKSQMNSDSRQGLDFLPVEGPCTWMNAVCLSLATKAVKGDISAIKYINEICQKEEETQGKGPLSITVKVVE